MEREFPARLTISPCLSTPLAAEEELRLAEAGFQPFYGADWSLAPSVFGLTSVPPPDRATFGYFAGGLTEKYHDTASTDVGLKLKAPKLEPEDNESSTSTFASKNVVSPRFHSLPDLRSFEPGSDQVSESPRPIGDLASFIESSHKRFRSPPRVSSLLPYPPPPPPPPPSSSGCRVSTPGGRLVVPMSAISRRRRQRIGDRMRILAGLMPWTRRMDTGTMLEEARKYVRFLEAQVTALQTMPASASGFVSMSSAGGVGGMERLSRQQLLRVMVGSAPAQDVLYRKGWCVFSAEQVAALRLAVERRPQLLMLLDGSTSG